MIKYILQVYNKITDIWEDTHSGWQSGYYDEDRFIEMLKSNLMYARKVYPDIQYRIIKREIIEEVIM